jgi:polyketide synthase PksJ
MARRAARQAQVVDLGEKIVHPLFDKRIVEADRHSYVTDFRVNKHWILNEHRILGNAVIPGTAFLEMARAAFKEYANNGEVELQNVTFLSPLIVKDDQHSEVHTIVEKNGDGFNFKIVSRLAPANGGEPAWQEHAIGKLNSFAAEAPKQYEIAKLARGCNEQHIITLEEATGNGHGNYIAFGPRWKSLKWVDVGSEGLLGFLELPEEFSADLEEFELHPALMDLATGMAARQIGGGFYLPLSYGRVKVKGRLPGKCFAYIKSDQLNRDKKETLSFDVLLLDENGAERVEVEGFMLKKVGSAAAKANDAVAEVVPQPEPTSGITPAEGVEAFRRILSTTGLPQIVISPRPLQALIDKSEAYTQDSIVEKSALAESSSPQYPRPALQTTYVAPRSEVEQHVASIWQKLLGIERVGIHDNFFELGGHSLLTLQVMSRLRETFQLELPMRDVFEATTVAELAKVIEEIVMAKIVEKIGNLTDEEARLLL